MDSLTNWKMSELKRNNSREMKPTTTLSNSTTATRTSVVGGMKQSGSSKSPKSPSSPRCLSEKPQGLNENGLSFTYLSMETPVFCLAPNSTGSQLVVGGRNLLKVYDAEQAEFTELLNLRVGLPQGSQQHCSPADVAWSPHHDNLIASTGNNGAVVLWDLNKGGCSKQEYVFSAHPRTVNRLIIHPTDPNLMMSGSQDGLMKLFDIRSRALSSTFNGNTNSSIRDIQFNPVSYHRYAAAFDAGVMQLWDIRSPNKWDRQYLAHNGPVLSIDWHREHSTWLASGGRDKLIHVYDTGHSSKLVALYTVQTIAGVTRLKWRPDCSYQICSSALLTDYGINTWDLRRPYAPVTSFPVHRDIVAGICFKSTDPNIFYTASRDGLVVRNLYSQPTYRPQDSFNPVTVNVGVRGSLLHAANDQLFQQTSSSPSAVTGALSRFPSYSHPSLPPATVAEESEAKMVVLSLLSHFKANECLSMAGFVEMAKRYKLKTDGDRTNSVSDICEYNAQVAASQHSPQIARSWMILAVMHADHVRSNQVPTAPPLTVQSASEPSTPVTVATFENSMSISRAGSYRSLLSSKSSAAGGVVATADESSVVEPVSKITKRSGAVLHPPLDSTLSYASSLPSSAFLHSSAIDHLSTLPHHGAKKKNGSVAHARTPSGRPSFVSAAANLSPSMESTMATSFPPAVNRLLPVSSATGLTVKDAFTGGSVGRVRTESLPPTGSSAPLQPLALVKSETVSSSNQQFREFKLAAIQRRKNQQASLVTRKSARETMTAGTTKDMVVEQDSNMVDVAKRCTDQSTGRTRPLTLGLPATAGPAQPALPVAPPTRIPSPSRLVKNPSLSSSSTSRSPAIMVHDDAVINVTLLKPFIDCWSSTTSSGGTRPYCRCRNASKDDGEDDEDDDYNSDDEYIDTEEEEEEDEDDDVDDNDRNDDDEGIQGSLDDADFESKKVKPNQRQRSGLEQSTNFGPAYCDFFSNLFSFEGLPEDRDGFEECLIMSVGASAAHASLDGEVSRSGAKRSTDSDYSAGHGSRHASPKPENRSEEKDGQRVEANDINLMNENKFLSSCAASLTTQTNVNSQRGDAIVNVAVNSRFLPFALVENGDGHKIVEDMARSDVVNIRMGNSAAGRGAVVGVDGMVTFKQDILEAPPFHVPVIQWNSTSIVGMLEFFADQNDVQTAVSMIIVLGESILKHIRDDRRVEHWFFSYIDVLSRLELWNVATLVINLSALPEITQLTLTSTQIYTFCARCSKPLTRAGWACHRCNQRVYTCSLCHLPARGLFVWCQGCAHGGHPDHMRSWFSNHRQCPTGCGHECELS